MVKTTIGVLALQGAFAKHSEMLYKLDVGVIEIRKPEELLQCDGLIIPGGESTTMMHQMEFIDFSGALRQFASQKPVFGTCAGLILMSEKILSSEKLPFGFLSVTVERNAFGRQLESFRIPVDIAFEGSKIRNYPAFFIRAPRIREYSPSVTVLSTYQNEPIFVQQNFHLGCTFHPELTQDASIHRYFLQVVEKVKRKNK